MLDKLTSSMDFHAKALVLRSERQRVIASNIANADTPGYAARDMSFADAMRDAAGNFGGATGATGASGGQLAMATSGRSTYSAGASTDSRHIALTSGGTADGGFSAQTGYAAQTQPRLDGNSVDLDRERAAFADNAVRYEATLRFINGQGKTMLAAITGQ